MLDDKEELKLSLPLDEGLSVPVKELLAVSDDEADSVVLRDPL